MPTLDAEVINHASVWRFVNDLMPYFIGVSR
jgi:hypothetical protein